MVTGTEHMTCLDICFMGYARFIQTAMHTQRQRYGHAACNTSPYEMQ